MGDREQRQAARPQAPSTRVRSGGERRRQRQHPSISGVITKPRSLAIERAKRGDPDVQAQFFQRHQPGLFAYFAGPRHWHWPLVPDLVQETIARAITSFSGLRGNTEAQAERWLYGIARNVHLQEVSRQVGIRLRIEVATELAKHVHVPCEDWARIDILDALDELPLPQVEVLRMMLEGLTIREIALELDVPEGTVATRIHRARKRLRRLLGFGIPAGSA
jgi:RNA polymerase sigma-70 factor (ECF subfamily)